MALLDQLRAGQIKVRDLEKHASSIPEAFQTRRDLLTAATKADFKHTAQFSFDAATAVKYNAENIIGATQLPLGVTEPLQVNGDHAKGQFYVPLATTEKSLIASISRGCKTITLSGGASVWIQKDAMTRAPLFKVPSLEVAKELLQWVKDHFDQLKTLTHEVSSHSDLLSFEPWIAGRNVFLRFAFSTGDAMGMNMVTRASDKIGKTIAAALPAVEFLSVSSNMCTDKKPAALNLTQGRGKTVHVECTIPKEIITKVLKSTAAGMAEIAYRKNLVGSAYAGSTGFNAHFANTVAAAFIATGQDPAHVVDASQGFALMEANDDGSLHASVTIPSLNVATIGGGTRLGTQQEALQMLGCAGSGNPSGSNSRKLAEIIAAAVLAGELSIIAAQAQHQLADAHKITAQ